MPKIRIHPVFTFFVLVVAFLWLRKEWYPFSHFPMYSKFSKNPMVVHVADGSGNPIASGPALGIRAGAIKKMYDRKLRRVAKALDTGLSDLTPEQKRRSGEEVLIYLLENRPANAPPLPPELQLFDMRIFLEEGQLAETKEKIATLKTAR